MNTLRHRIRSMSCNSEAGFGNGSLTRLTTRNVTMLRMRSSSTNDCGVLIADCGVVECGLWNADCGVGDSALRSVAVVASATETARPAPCGCNPQSTLLK